MSSHVHRPELGDGFGMILSRGLLGPWQRLLVVHIDTVAKVVHVADLILAPRFTPSPPTLYAAIARG